MLNLVKELCMASGPSSYEEEVRALIRSKAEPYADSIRVDALGNLIVFKKGKKATGNKLMLCAHMDEVGIIIQSIDDNGYLRFKFLGGVDRRVVLGKPVWLGPNRIPGVIGLKTGTTHMAGDCVVGLLRAEDKSGVAHDVVVVQFGAEDETIRATLSEELIRYGKQKVESQGM